MPQAPHDVLRRILEARLSAPQVVGGMTPRPPPPARLLLAAYAEENLGDPGSYPASASAFRYVASRLSLASLGEERPALPSSGGTESNIMALYAARESGRRRVVASRETHYSVFKAARILAMRVDVVERLDYDSVKASAREDTVVVATVGTTETGYVEPVPEIVEAAEEVGALVHVDAAFAGPVARFTAPQRAPRLDDTARWLAVDAHKIVDAPFQAGVLLARAEEDLEALWFEAPYTPTGRQPGLLGSRAGAPFVAAAALIASIEASGGFESLAARLMGYARWVVEELVERGPYETPHEPMTPVVCLTHPQWRSIVDALRRRGLRPYTCPRYGGVRLAFTSMVGDDDVWALVEAMRSAAETAARG